MARGSTSSKGSVTDDGPAPATYTFDYDGGGGSQRLHVTFDKGAVTQVSMQPPNKPSRHDVPVTKEQLQGVLDPVTAMIFMPAPKTPMGTSKYAITPCQYSMACNVTISC